MASYESFEDVNSGKEYDMVFVRHLYYLFENEQKEMVVPTTAWCFDCDDLVIAEHFSDEAEKEETRQKLQAVIDGDRDPRLILGLEKPFEQSARDQLEESERYWSLFENRTSPPKCLRCASTNFQVIKLDENDACQVEGGPLIKSTGCGFCDIGLEPEILLTPEGIRIE